MQGFKQRTEGSDEKSWVYRRVGGPLAQQQHCCGCLSNDHGDTRGDGEGKISRFHLLNQLNTILVVLRLCCLTCCCYHGQCVHLTVPQNDDAHVIFLAIPSLAAEEDGENPEWPQEQREIEEFFVHQMAEMQKYKVRATLPRNFPEKPGERISTLMQKFLAQYDGDLKAGCKIVISNPQSTASRTVESFWFTPIVINHIRKSVRSRDDVGNKNPLEGFEMCFENTSDRPPMLMVVESVLVSEASLEAGQNDDKPVFESSSLTPLAEQLAESIDSANSVLNEMRYMEGRERRMRQTADSINARVKYFSYISVIVLIVVTYVQVTYLKRYFRKKKLL